MPGGHCKIKEWQDENPEEALEAKRKAGRASGKSRREKKMLKDYLLALLEAKTETGTTYYDEITLALVKKALGGDVPAYTTIRSTIGQDAPQQIEMSTNTINVNIGE